MTFQRFSASVLWPPGTILREYRYYHRIAVANIATTYYCEGIHGPFALAIENDNARKAGRPKKFGAIGGGALVSKEGADILDALGPVVFERHDDNVRIDARMTFGANTEMDLQTLRTTFLRTMLEWARAASSDLIELDLTREFEEELVTDHPGIITGKQLATIRTRLAGWKCGVELLSSRGPRKTLTTPAYLCHEVHFEDPAVLAALLNDPLHRVRMVSAEELKTTNSGSTEGRTHDDFVLFANVFVPEVIRSFFRT